MYLYNISPFCRVSSLIGVCYLRANRSRNHQTHSQYNWAMRATRLLLQLEKLQIACNQLFRCYLLSYKAHASQQLVLHHRVSLPAARSWLVPKRRRIVPFVHQFFEGIYHCLAVFDIRYTIP